MITLNKIRKIINLSIEKIRTSSNIVKGVLGRLLSKINNKKNNVSQIPAKLKPSGHCYLNPGGSDRLRNVIR